AVGPGRGAPLVLGVRDDDLAVRELDLVAGAVVHDVGRGDDPGRLSVGPDQVVADLDLPHRRPARGGRQGTCGVQRLPHGGPGGDHDHLPGVEAVGEGVEVGEAGGAADHLAAAAADRLDLVQGARHDLAEGDVVLGGALLRDGVDLRLCAVEDLVGVRPVRG